MLESLVVLSQLSPEVVLDWFCESLNNKDVNSMYPTPGTPAKLPGQLIERARSHLIEKRPCVGEGDLIRLQNTQKDPEKPWQCIRCGKAFNNKGNWKQHMEINDPQKGWVCNFEPCTDSLLRDKTFSRSDHAKKHFTMKHEGLDIDMCMKNWMFTVEKPLDEQCGFCRKSKRFNVWMEWLSHLDKHFYLEKKDMSQWNSQGLISDDESSNGINGDDESRSSNSSECSNGRRGQDDSNYPDASNNGNREKQSEKNPDITPNRVQGHCRSINFSTASRLPPLIKEEATHKFASDSKFMSFPVRTKPLSTRPPQSSTVSSTKRTLNTDIPILSDHFLARLMHVKIPLQKFIEQKPHDEP